LVSLSKASAPVGAIVHSDLTLVQFQAENLGSWKLMDGSSCAGSLYSQIRGVSVVPNAMTEGTFLRQAKSGRTIGSYESDDNKQHTHIQDAHYHNEANGYGSSGYWGNDAIGVGSQFFGHGDGFTTNSNRTRVATATNQNSGSTEARPKNLAVNMFIKIDY
jgi:hypothetical protein